MVAAFLLLVGGHALGWGRRPLARDPVFLAVIVMSLIAVWIAPRPAVWWSRLTFTLALPWLAFKVYVPH